jgi:isocitrate dehydrogenase
MPNLYGDIVSDITAQISGSVGLAGTANIGQHCAMFEAIHGSAPDIAGKGIANPSGLIKASVLMLNHIGQQEVAERIINAWLKTIEDGIHTGDIFKVGVSKKTVSTNEFTNAVIERLGQLPKQFEIAKFNKEMQISIPAYSRKKSAHKLLKGVDVFVDWKGEDPNILASRLQKLSKDLHLTMITNRGVKVWPNGFNETFCTDHWRCRFEKVNGEVAKANQIPELLTKALLENIDVIKTENLYDFDGVRGYSLGQGQ